MPLKVLGYIVRQKYYLKHIFILINMKNIITYLSLFILIIMGSFIYLLTKEQNIKTNNLNNLSSSSITPIFSSSNSSIEVKINTSSSASPTYTLNIPSLNKINNSTYQIIINLSKDYKIYKYNDFILNIEKEGLKIQLGAVTGDSDFGFLPSIPEHTIIKTTFSNKIYEYLETDSGNISDLRNLIGNYNYYYHYSDKFLTGKDCGVLDGYFCITPYINLMKNNKQQPFKFICAVNNKSLVRDCDLILNSININL